MQGDTLESAQLKILEGVKLGLRRSARELSQWKLYKSAKWSAEALHGLTNVTIDTNAADSSTTQDNDSPLRNRINMAIPSSPQVPAEQVSGPYMGLTESEYDLYLFISTLFDCKEFDRCVFFLRDAEEPRLKFLQFYSEYLSWDKKTRESTENVLMTGKPDKKSEKELSEKHLLGSNFLQDNTQKQSEGVFTSETGQQTSLAIILNELRVYLKKLDQRSANTLGLALLHYLKGVLLNRQGNKSHALSAFLESLSYYTFNWTCWLELLDCITRPDESSLILRHLNEKFIIKGDEPVSQNVPENNIMLQFFKLALLQEFNYSGSVDEFFFILENLLILLPNFTYLKSQSAIMNYNYMDYSVAENIFDNIFKCDPYRLEDLDIYSNILYVMQKHSKLAYLAQYVSHVDRFRPETCCIVANYYSARQEHEKSIMYFRRALVLNKKSTSAWTLMGHEFVELKNSHAAIECYRRAVDINERDYKAWFGLGQAYEVLDMHLYSLYYFQKACTLKPLDRRMWQALAECYGLLKNSEQAIECYRRALQLSSNAGQDVLLLFRMAEQYELILDIESCKQNMLKCVALEDSSDGSFVTDETVKARLWLARYEMRMHNYQEAYDYAKRISNGTSQEIEEARTIARNCRQLFN
ncbi:anaphase promoting complex subunit CDC23 KNAG_0E00680 [Huiozyma naganishii CBS 8797]|uniref:Cdc23 domain-containing protein n=1 Tax=Huiozyma naganishii (strain ATCC MYA-139 / BCRC 22969 / CBS 8797 / KCTC 17520 / NBRC 10181 / NCYC 3082 / Yp74L-3) TaxID=1071383 RepID=J7S7H0_HUIN7|nr:hypothetical protein KNAG_0E00680 [Kazachstania naganishii CBS 8797]CCK70336.1 hypothetical protein KNAG_0E00680 [Kazachstania naganishii CBS 8797]